MPVLKIGSLAPDFSLLDQNEELVSLRAFRGKKLVLYFYPKDHTPGCTAEACDFSQLFDDFAARGVAIIGLSPDSPKSHANFASKFALRHILLSDPEREVARAYGAYGVKKLYGKAYEGVLRTSFLIDEEGVIIEIFENVKVPGHAQALLEKC